MDDIDGALSRLAQAPVPPALDALEARVLARISAAPPSRTGVGVGVITVAALAIGMASAGIPVAAGTAAPLSPLGPDSALAPSTLLAGTP